MDSTSSTQSASLFKPRFEPGYIINKTKEILLNPGTCWQTIKRQPETINDLYGRWLMFMAAIPPLGMFIGGVANGYLPVVRGAVFAILQYVLSLAMVYVIACVIEFLAPKFQGSASRTDAARLVAYAGTPNYVAGVLHIIPGLRGVGLIFALYGFYLFYTGIPEMTSVPASKRIVFLLAIIAITILIAIFVVPFLMGVLGFGGAGMAALSGGY